MSSSSNSKRSAPSDDEDDARSSKRAASSAAAEDPRPRASNLEDVFQISELLGIVQEYSNLNDIANLSNAYAGVRERTIPIPDWVRSRFLETNIHESAGEKCNEYAQRLLSNPRVRMFLTKHLFPAEAAFEAWRGNDASRVVLEARFDDWRSALSLASSENSHWVQCWTSFMQNVHPKIETVLGVLFEMSYSEHSFLKYLETGYNNMVTVLNNSLPHNQNYSLLFSRTEIGFLLDGEATTDEFANRERLRSKKSELKYAESRHQSMSMERIRESFEMFLLYRIPILFRFVRAALVFMNSFYNFSVQFAYLDSMTSLLEDTSLPSDILRVSQNTVGYVAPNSYSDNVNLRTVARQQWRYTDGEDIHLHPWTHVELFHSWVKNVEFYKFLDYIPDTEHEYKRFFYERFITPTRIVNAARDFLKQEAERHYHAYQKDYVHVKKRGNIYSLFQRERLRLEAKKQFDNEIQEVKEEREGKENKEEERKVEADGNLFYGVQIPRIPRHPQNEPQDFSNSGTQPSVDFEDSVDSLVKKLDEVLRRFGN